MKDAQNPPSKRSGSTVKSGKSSTPSPSLTGRGLEGAIGDALSRVLEKAGLDLRVVPIDATAKQSRSSRSSQKVRPKQPAPAATDAAAPHLEPKEPAPARSESKLSSPDALVAVAALVLGRELLATMPVDRGSDASAPAMAHCDKLSDLLTAAPLQSAESMTAAAPSVTPTPGQAGSTSLRDKPAAAKTAPARERNVTIRY